MTLNQLEYFQKVATLQHFRQAAELLKISQPSLSRFHVASGRRTWTDAF